MGDRAHLYAKAYRGRPSEAPARAQFAILTAQGRSQELVSLGGVDQLHLALTSLSTPTLCHPVNVATNGTPVDATVTVRGPASSDQATKSSSPCEGPARQRNYGCDWFHDRLLAPLICCKVKSNNPASCSGGYL